MRLAISLSFQVVWQEDLLHIRQYRLHSPSRDIRFEGPDVVAVDAAGGGRPLVVILLVKEVQQLVVDHGEDGGTEDASLGQSPIGLYT